MAKIKKNLAYMYGEDARIKIKGLASLFKESPQRTKYSLKLLEKDGILYNPYCIFDYSYFGLILFRMYFKGAYISEKDKEEIIKQLKENEFVVSIYELSGEFDLVLEIEAPNPSKFNKIIREMSSKIPTFRHYKIVLNLVTHIYPRAYLTNDETLQSYFPLELIIGGDRDVKNFTENEKGIIKCLLNNPKLRMSSIAKQSGLNIKTAKSLLKILTQKKVIRGFKFIIDTNKLNIYKFRLFLKLHNLSNEREEAMMDYLLKTKEIVQVHKTVGDWDLELDIESPDKTTVRKLTIEIREGFRDIIETFNIMEFYHYYKRSYLPKYLFEKQ